MSSYLASSLLQPDYAQKEMYNASHEQLLFGCSTESTSQPNPVAVLDNVYESITC